MSKRNQKKKTRLTDLVKTAHDAGTKVSVSLEPKDHPYWQVVYLAASGEIGSVSVNTPLEAVQMVARLLDASSNITSISITAGKIHGS